MINYDKSKRSLSNKTDLFSNVVPFTEKILYFDQFETFRITFINFCSIIACRGGNNKQFCIIHLSLPYFSQFFVKMILASRYALAIALKSTQKI